MKTFSPALFLFLCFLFTGNLASGQNYFRVVNGIPHLSVTDPASVKTPETGMLIYGSTENKPLIYTGSEWETLCTSNIFKITAEDYFTVKNGISYLPVLDHQPVTDNKPGTIYYSLTNRSAMIHDGNDWVKIQALNKTVFAANPGFTTGANVKTFKLPVLIADPAPSGLTKGAFYINSIAKTIRYFDGTAWLDLRCMPELFTLTPTQVKGSSAISGGDVISNGGLNIITSGLCWSTNPDPTIALSTKTAQSVNGEGLGIFTNTIKNLLPNTTYHVRAYVINEMGVFYGDDKIFETGVDLPTIITLPVTDITSTTALSGGDISDNGGSAVTSRGIRWSIKGDPLDDPDAEVTDDGSGVGAFPSTMIGMMGNTTYYVRAYAVNSAGTAYGELLQFTTDPATAPVLSLATINIRDITHQSAVGAVTILNNGGALITQRGLAWSTDKVNWTFGVSATVNSSDIGVFISNLTRLTPGTTYYAKGYATNSVGTTYSSETSFRTSSSIAISTLVPSGISGTTAFSGGSIAYNGGSGITERGICWGTNEMPVTNLDNQIVSPLTNDGIGTYNTRITKLQPGVTYYVRAYAVNELGTAYGEQYSFTTMNLPQVTTLTANAIAINTATARGQVIDDGGSEVTSRGTVWTTDSAAITAGVMSTDGGGKGLFSSKMTDLIAGTTYYYRAYAANEVGTAYGSLLQLTTLPAVKPVLSSSLLDIAATTTTKATGKFSLLNNGGSPVITSGILYSIDKINYLDEKSISGPVNGAGNFLTNLTDLRYGTTYYAKGYVTTIAGTVYTDETSFTTPLPISIATTIVSRITSNVAYSGGEIIDPGNSSITSRGICWSITANPTIGNESAENGAGPGIFTGKMTGLTGSTRYYVRAYAYNNTGLVYGNQVTFMTAPAGLASVTTSGVNNIGGISAVGIGQVTDHGGDVVSGRGLVWNTTGDPAITDNHTENGSDVGNFSGIMSGLTPLTKYYVKAYAINGIGISYGDELTFTTATTATVTTLPISAITTLTANGGGEITSDGGTLVTQSGICWNTTGTPTITDLRTANGTGIGEFINQMTGLTGSTTYYVRAYAVNSAGIAYGEVKQFTTAPPTVATLTTKISKSGEKAVTGYSGGLVSSNGGTPLTGVGVVWSLTPGFDPAAVPASNRITQTGTENFDVTLTPLTPGTTYYARAFAINKIGTAYAGNEEHFTTFTLPVVTTADVAATDITHIEAIAGGSILKDGGTKIINSGICWSTGLNPSITDSHTTNATGTGDFTARITDLLGSTTYYVRAYAINSVGIVYGEVKSFTTLPPVPATLRTSPVTDISAVAATSGGEILTNGGALVTTRGIIWDTHADLDLDKAGENKTAETGYFTGSFTGQIKGLTENTVYYVRAYVISKVGIAYGNVISFRTPQHPQITTLPATSIRSNSAISGGNISDEGGANVSSRGLMWSVSKDFNPDTVAVNRTSDGTRGGVFNSRLTSLKANTTYYMLAYATNIAGTSYGNLLSFTTDVAKLPTVLTSAATGLRGVSASSGGQVTDNGGDAVTSRGILWSTDAGFRPDAPNVQKRLASAPGNGGFNVALTGLTPGTKYYVKAYAVNVAGTAYGAEISFTTPVPPSLTTNEVSVASAGTTAVGGGTILSDGGATLSDQGVVWSTQPNPVTGLVTKTRDIINGNSFSSTMTGLLPVTTYYVRAYAINAEGLSYGNEVVFTTPPVLPSLTTTLVTPSSKSSATTGGNISKDGGAEITARGVVWSKDRNFNPDTELINRTNDGTGKGVFTSEMTNMDLSVSYYVRAYATNSVGTAYGNQISVTLFPTAPLLRTKEITNIGGFAATSGGEITSDGGADVTQKGLCWSTRPNPTVNDSKSVLGAGTDPFTGALSGLSPNTLYYVRAYAVNKIGTAYGLERTVLTNAYPTLTLTAEVTDIIATTATSGGVITDDGRTPILTRGIVWNTTGNPVIGTASQTLDNVTQGTGSFVAYLKGLKDNTTYYVRAYATNSVGITYGTQVSFTTLEVMLPALTTIPPSLIGSSFATGGGNITDDGGMPVSARGIVWNTSPNPTISLTTKLNHNTSGTGSYTDVFGGLLPATQYYVRAYATNSKGTAYGLDEVFKTTIAIPGISAATLTKPTMTGADATATLGSIGGAEITAQGFYWSTSADQPALPLAAERMSPANLNQLTVSGTITGLESSVKYYIWAYATNSAGTGISSVPAVFTTPGIPQVTTTTPYAITSIAATSGGTVTYDGGSAILAKGVVWSTEKNPAIELTTKINNGAGIGGYSTSITGLNRGTKYYVRAYATNSVGTGYGSLDSLTTTDIPKLKTVPATSITNNTAISGGEIISDGGVNITNKGLVWSTEKDPTILLTTKVSNGAGNAGFISNISGLVLATKYYFRAYATNSVGTGYGNLDSLATPAIPPVLSTVKMSDVTPVSAKAAAEVTSAGGAEVTARGFVWNTTGNPTVETDKVIALGAGTGSFDSLLEHLVIDKAYYIRAYATNAAGTGYSAVVTSFISCSPTFTVVHKAGVNGAPVDKTVVYGVVSTDMSGAAKCWITQNLGADRQATMVGDATEASAGWYWQFNRGKGYKFDTVRIPNADYAAWETQISENSTWLAANDPCIQLLGSGWRLPTAQEWRNVIAPPQNWKTAADGFNSVLKIHSAGYLNTAGILAGKGSGIYYWSSTELSTTAASALIGSTTVNTGTKAEAASVRCLRDDNQKTLPMVTNVLIPLDRVSAAATEVTATVTKDGGAAVTARGLVWNTTGNPTLADGKVMLGTGLGLVTGTLTNLNEEPVYYVRAFATNSEGTAYSALTSSFRICSPVTAIHKAGLNGAATDKTVTYKTVSSMITGSAQCWITQNLGSDRQALALTDATESSAGWYWQFNRLQGYKNDGTAFTPVNAWTPWVTTTNGTSNWTADNDPCVQLLGGGWRLPTDQEWRGIRKQTEYWLTAAQGYNSELKLHNAGYLSEANGGLNGRGTNYNYYWSSTTSGATMGSTFLYTDVSTISRNAGLPVRCLRDAPLKMVPVVSNVVVPVPEMTVNTAAASATVVAEGSSAVTARGLVWGTTDNPTLNDQFVVIDKGTGDYKGTLDKLVEGPTYYVRAFATSAEGTGYSAVATAFKICNPFTIIHKAGVNGAPVDKTVTYQVISSNASGAPRCWITQNLGADRQAATATESAEAAAGWYWQFNRVKGYKFDTVRIPNGDYAAWEQTITESSPWLAANDPCIQLLGGGWRLPTAQEWRNVIAPPQNWKTAADGFNSVLKIHTAGYLNSAGNLGGKGSGIYYWSSTELSTTAASALIGSTTVNTGTKAEGSSVRCLRDDIQKTLPTVSNVLLPADKITATAAEATATVSKDGGAAVTARGLVWNTTGNPTLADSKVMLGTGLGLVTGTLTGLSEEPVYYVRAFATNSEGTAYSALTSSFRICSPVTAIHKAGLNGAATDKTVTYKTVSSTVTGSAQCWITQNLGSDRQALALTDATEPSAGWYWQFNRLQGYKNDGTSFTPVNAWTPWVTTTNGTSNWTADNDPCVQLLGGGWRLPTDQEWRGIRKQTEYWLTATQGYNSELKLHNAGYLSEANGGLNGRGTNYNYYWSSTASGTAMGSTFLYTDVSTISRNAGLPVRCLRDAPMKMVPVVSNVVVPVPEMTVNTAAASATVVAEGSSAVTARGLVWGTTDNPTLNDQFVVIDKGTGDYKGTLDKLVEGPTYYVRAFATSAEGTGYSAVATAFKICNPFTIVHKAGVNGAPVDKTVTYQVISSNASGAPRCWITQNLGADRQAATATESAEAAAGWYWQFNRGKGYKFDTVRIPNGDYAAWEQTITESSPWLAINDPCIQLLGGGWRLPTAQEWRNVIAPPQNWKTAADGFNSVLKIHTAGYLNNAGNLGGKGSGIYYWSSTELSTTAASVLVGANSVNTNGKADGLSVRCLRDDIQKTLPTVSNVLLPADKITATAAEATATVSKDGGAAVTARGLVWNTTGNPTLADSKVTLGNGLGLVTGTLTGLSEEPVYYVRAYATNSEGTAYSALTSSFRICSPVTAIHKAGLNGAATDKTVTYKTVSSMVTGSTQCWITQNLGSDRQALALTDATEPSAGWYWQFNRLQGYKNDGGAFTPVKPGTPWVTTTNGTSNWTADNDPCVQLLGGGWRLPTDQEWRGIRKQTEYWLTAAQGYNSELKLHNAGYLSEANGGLNGRGTNYNYYWSSTASGTTMGSIFLYTDVSTISRNAGLPVRCLRDAPVK